MNEQEIEKEIQEKGLTAKRVTPDHIDSVIISDDYHVFRDTCLTVCVLTLRNGFTVTGESACASPENFNEEIGRKIARENARNKIWALEGYLLKQRLFDQERRVEMIASIAHEINAAYCLALGDDSQTDWDDAPQWQRDSAINGVIFHMQNPTASPAASHESWLKEKVDSGWFFGEIKDPEAKTHPCCVPFEALPVEQRAKDYLFRQVVHSLSQ